MFIFFISILILASRIASQSNYAPANTWNVNNFKNLVVFGDSYTDENRLNYFVQNKGSSPPTGYYSPESYNTASGGRTWARYIIQYTGLTNPATNQFTPSLTLYNYATSGAVLSNDATPRYFPPISAPFPDVTSYQIPAFLSDSTYTNPQTSQPYFQPAINATNTVAILFIGTNDLGVGAYLTNSQKPGYTLASFVDSTYKALDQIYSSGIRHMVLFNIFPLDLAPLYANASFGGGVKPEYYWRDRPDNTTEISNRMRENVNTVNQALATRTSYEVLTANRYPGAEIVTFDVNAWATQVYRSPAAYLNGSDPFNVKEPVRRCSDANCSGWSEKASRDSYFWWDSLHPGEQIDRVLAREVVSVLDGRSGWAGYFSG